MYDTHKNKIWLSSDHASYRLRKFTKNFTKKTIKNRVQVTLFWLKIDCQIFKDQTHATIENI
jgi:hypothetical protein